MTSNSEPLHPNRKSRRKGVAVVLIAAVTATVAVLVTLAATGRHRVTTSAQALATPPPTGTPWPMPTQPPLTHPLPVWLDPAGEPLAELAPATITARCTRDNFTVHVAPELPTYPRGTAVIFRVTITFTGPNPCVFPGATYPTVSVYDSDRTRIWTVGGKYGDARPNVPMEQLPEAGDTLAEEVWWPQDECYFGHCPGTEAPSGTYNVQVFFWPYGQSDRVTFQID